MLMDHRDAAGHCICWPVSDERLAIEDDRTGVRRDQAEQHLHKRALARAVLAQKTEDFAALEIKIDAVHRTHRAKAARDSAHFEKLAHEVQVQRDKGSTLLCGQRAISKAER